MSFKKKPLNDEAKRSDGEDPTNSAEFSVGDKVDVQSETSSKTKAGTVARLHRNGTYGIKYEDGEVEKYVNEDRISKLKKGKKSSKKMKTDAEYDVDMTVEVQDVDESEVWDEAIILKVQNNGRYTVKFVDGEMEEDVPDKRIRVGRKIRNRSKLGSFKDIKSKLSPLKSGLKIGSRVNFREGSSGDWAVGVILKVRQDGTYDIADESDEESIFKKVKGSNVQIMKGNSSFSTSFRRKNKVNKGDNVVYEDKKGKNHRGKVVRVRDDKFIDIQHDSDEEFVAKRIMMKNARVVNSSYFSWKFPSLSLTNLSQLFPLTNSISLNSNVRFYDSKERIWRDGIIKKVRSNHKLYDIEFEDDCDDDEDSDYNTDIAKNVPRKDIRSINKYCNSSNFSCFVPNFFGTPLKVGMLVEVSKKRGAKIGKIFRDNQDGTYTIKYENGEMEKGVSLNSIRLISTNVRVGVKVKFIVEDSGIVSEERKGEIVWIHRDNKVSVRSRDEIHNVDRSMIYIGGESETSIVASSFEEQLCYSFNMVLESAIFMWFIFGVCVEISQGFDVFNLSRPYFLESAKYMRAFYSERENSSVCLERKPSIWNNLTHLSRNKYALIPETVLQVDRFWLLTLIIVNVILISGFITMQIYYVWIKVAVYRKNAIEYSESIKVMKLKFMTSLFMVIVLLVSCSTLICYGSLLNKFSYYCLWDDTEDKFQFDYLALKVNPFVSRNNHTNIIEAILGVSGMVCINLFRAIALGLVIELGSTLKTRLLMFVPAILVTIFICINMVSSLHILHYVQRIFVSKNIMTLNSEIDLAVTLVLFGYWLNSVIYYVFSTIGKTGDTIESSKLKGRIPSKTLEQAELGKLGVQAKQESKLERRDMINIDIGKWNLGLIELHKLLLLHLAVAVFSIISNVLLQKTLNDYSTNWSRYTTNHIVIASIWVVILSITPCVVSRIRSEFPELRKGSKEEALPH